MSSINVDTIKSRLGGPPTLSKGVVVSAAATFSGDVSIGGTITYEDVTNVDSVGLITARSGIEFGASGVGGTITAAGNAAFENGLNVKNGLDVSGISTVRGGIEIGASGVGGTISAGGNVKFTGITTVGAGLSFADDIKAKFGAGGDLSIYHNGSNSYIDNNTASVYIRSNVDGDDGGNIYIQAKSGEDSIVCNDDGNVQLYYDNYNAFQTNANGIKVQGPSGGAAILYLNADQGSDDADKFRFKAEDDGPLKIENDTSGSWETSIEINGNGNVELYYDNVKKIETLSTGVKVTGVTSTTSFSVGPGLLQEKSEVPASALTGTVNFDIIDDGMVHWHYTNASGTWIVNLRGDGSTTFNSIMDIGKTAVFTLYSASNNTSYYMTDFKIDGVSITERWNGGSAPSAGTGSGTDVYTFNIFKTGDAAYTVYATFSNFA